MDKNTKTLLSVFLIVIVMVGMAFASVPLYKLFCQVTGFGGITQVAENAPDHILDREIRVMFNTDTGAHLPLTFHAETREITTPIGQQTLIVFKARNLSDKPFKGTAIHNVSPPKTGKYFHKTECFCFAEQTIPAGAEVTMPVVFFIDPKLDNDRGMDDVITITLSYTFFESNTKALDEALEDFYNAPTY